MKEEIKTLAKLYKKTTTGAIQEWQVGVYTIDGIATIVSNYGQLNGKIQENHEQVLEGKNTGKSNATTSIRQALLQAESDWNSKLKNGYVKNISDAEAGKTDDIIGGGIFPMLAHKFSEQGHKIVYPALCQPKMDGQRAVYQNVDGNGSLWSRKRKPINSVPHIIKALENIKELKDIKYLDGELYGHDYHDNFEELSHFIRQEEYLEGSEVIEYHVYDLPNTTLTNAERNEFLQGLKPVFENTVIRIVETVIVNDEEELMDAFQHFLDEGYEGCMVRNIGGLYVNKRSYDLLKVKEFDDAEFKVVDIKVGTKGRMAGKAVFVCETTDGAQFAAKMIGNIDALAKYAENPELAIGRIMTVKFQGYTKKNNVPRFPVAMRFREDI